MNIKKLFKNIILTACFCVMLNVDVFASNVVRVACIIDEGFYIEQENGKLSGYNYDYLMQVALHTGWDYEFVIIDEGNINSSYSKAVNMLENGELDLIGSAFKNEYTEEIFEFPNIHSGITRYCLMSLANNYKITTNNYFLKDSLSIALVNGDEALNNL
ncbi:MAG: transporter substrate-binding domain-containing protein, partial [Clostridia bacterium]